MPIPTVQELYDIKTDADDLESLVNGSSTVDTRLGGAKDSYTQLVARISHGDITTYSAVATYTAFTDWVIESGIVYRPIPSSLPIGPEAFDSSKWIAVQLNIEDADKDYSATFATVADMKNGDKLSGKSISDYSALAAVNAVVRTVVNNTTSKKGGAEYIIKTAAQVSADGDVIDGDANHWLLGAENYAAIKRKTNYTDIYTMGAIDGVDIAPILNSAYTDKFKISGSHVCGIVERDSIDVRLYSATIDAPNAATTNLFLNIRDFRLTSYGHSEIGAIEPYSERVFWVESGNNLDNVFIGGDILVECGATTITAFGAESGVTPSTSLTIYISDLVEITGFTTSGIDFRCNAMDDNTDCYVGNIKSWGGSGRCIQFGDNSYGVNQVTVEDCPKLGFVDSSGSSEAKGILIYGRNATVDNNKIFNVKNAAASGGEGIYIKSSFSSITNNKLRNAGSSSDGCITLKGASYWDDLYADEGGYNVITGNTVELTSTDYDSKGIGIFDSNVTATNNILRDLRSGRSGLSYSEAFSIGGSSAVANVTVSDNIVTGWYNFCGNYADSAKGRCKIGDNIKIVNNTGMELDGGYVFTWDARCRISTRPMTFDAATKTITIDGGTSQNGEFERFIHSVGKTVVIGGTASNNGTFTISDVSRYQITTVEAIVDESATPTIDRESVDSLKIYGNSFSGFGTAIRSGGGKVNQLYLDDNDWSNGNYAYDLDTAGLIGELFIGEGETWNNLLNKQNGAPVADQVYYGMKLKTAGGGTMTITSYEIDYDVAYT